MPRLSRSALVPHTAEQMFDLVADVERYGEFLPFCSRGELLSADEQQSVGRVYLQKGLLKHHFTTRNLNERPTRITLELVDGPFRDLSGSWTFAPLDDTACRVTMELQFEFSNAVIEATFGRLFRSVSDMVLDAFCDRAEAVYG